LLIFRKPNCECLGLLPGVKTRSCNRIRIRILIRDQDEARSSS